MGLPEAVGQVLPGPDCRQRWTDGCQKKSTNGWISASKAGCLPSITTASSGRGLAGAGFLAVLWLIIMLLLVTRGPYQPFQNWVSWPPCWKRMWRTPGG